MTYKSKYNSRPVTWKAIIVLILAMFLIPFYYVAKGLAFISVHGSMVMIDKLLRWAEKKDEE